MKSLNFNEEFCFTVSVHHDEADATISNLISAKLRVQFKNNEDAPAMVDITVLCQKGMNDACKAVTIINNL